MAAVTLALLVQTLSASTPAAFVELRAPAIDAASLTLRAGQGWPDPEPFIYRTGLAEPAPAPVIDAGTRAAGKLLALADKVAQTGTDFRYDHRTRVRRREGLYHFDCSGMINWMLARVAPQALASIERERPVASSYVRTIAKAPTTRSRGGWRRIPTLAEVRPGDLFAWRRPKEFPPGGATGHVGIVLQAAQPLPHIEGAYLLRIRDSTRWRHQDDSRGPDDTGLGDGTILFMTDASGAPVGYGWHGEDSGGWYATQVVFGRVSK